MKTITLLVALAIASGELAAQSFPTRPPDAAPLRPVRFPPFVNAGLSNGASLLVVENHRQPLVTVTLALPAGGFFEPADRAGLASMVADLLTKGTARRDADRLAAEVEGAGGSIGSSAGRDFLTITVSGLAANLEQSLDILADIVTGATFPETEVELARTRALSDVQASLAQPQVLASRAFGRGIYGDHPYGRVETQASLRAITRDDVVGFFNQRVRPRGALPTRSATRIVLVHKPGAVQSNIVAGFPFIAPRDPDLYALTLMNRILGGGADSRLFLILREEKGWTYGAYSGFSRPRGTGAFQASAEVRTEVTDSALVELIAQLNRMRNEVPADSEVQAAKNYLVGRFPLSIETSEQIAGAVANARLLGLGDDYVLRYRERLAAVTRAQIGAAARNRLTTDRMVIVVVGDAPRILSSLRAIAPVEIVDTEGRPLTEADLTATPGAVTLDGSRVIEGSWRYRVLVQGNPFGEERRTIERVQADGRQAWRMITATRLGPILSQDDTVLVDAATLAPIRVRQGGVVQNQATRVSLDYASGRVRGNSRTPQAPGQMAERSVDTTAAAGTFDDNQLPLVLMALPLAAEARWNLPMFSGGDGAMKTYGVTVEGQQEVTVPAGTFRTWRLGVSGGQVPVTMYVSLTAPHVIVRIELTGAPLAFELVPQ
jgi:zinc protease